MSKGFAKQFIPLGTGLTTSRVLAANGEQKVYIPGRRLEVLEKTAE